MNCEFQQSSWSDTIPRVAATREECTSRELGEPLRTDHRKRKSVAARTRIRSGPLYVVAGILPNEAARVEARVRDFLGRGRGGEVFIPRVPYRHWYSADEVVELFRRCAQKVVGEAETAQQGELPTPSEVFLLHVRAPGEAAHATMMEQFEFWAWPEELRYSSKPPIDADLPASAQRHWSRTEIFASEAIVAAVRRLRASGSHWQRVAAKLRELKSALRLPPVNFHFPDGGSALADTYRRVVRGEDPQLPRLCRVSPSRRDQSARTESRILGDQHFQDAHERFFPPDKARHGALRELEGDRGREDRQRRVWLNAAYRFGSWIGELDEHYDVQRVDGGVSPPAVYCSLRDQWAEVSNAHVNVFVNDHVRDGQVFAQKAKTQG